ncbi:hypothetical protein ACJ72_07514 [Emergomyces africanus]|uniref:Uncharacterized protein n=1 Tax=Emergomyces africanus TaxID=1955775 RepID=A0A1B7NMY7_9EURO|nr:hypothetical protein ACJ72_07514 [Emergomyces africanus]
MGLITEIQGDLFDAPEGAALIHACNCQGSWGKGVAKDFKDKYPAAYQIFRSHCQQYLAHPQTQTHKNPILIPGKDTAYQQPRALKLPEGTALIIPPQPADYQPHSLTQLGKAPKTPPLRQPLATRRRGRRRGRGHGTLSFPRRAAALSKLAGRKHWIICLFTSWHYGPQNRSSPDVILENTMLALADLKRQIAADGAATYKSATAPTVDQAEAKVEHPGELWGCRFNAGLFGVPWEGTRKALEEAGLAMTIVRPLPHA